MTTNDPTGPSQGADARQRERVQRQVHGGGHRGAGIDSAEAGSGEGSIVDEPVLVVNQKAKLIELTNQYRVFDAQGTEIAHVAQVGQNALRKALRLFTSLDQFFPTRLEIRSSRDELLLQLTRPGKILKSTVIVANGLGVEVGRIVQKNMIGKINFELVANGEVVGAIKAENWRAWNFRIEDSYGQEVARITKTFEGVAKTLFTTADNYVLHVSQRPPEPLNSLVVASALSVDTALKQDARGLGA